MWCWMVSGWCLDGVWCLCLEEAQKIFFFQIYLARGQFVRDTDAPPLLWALDYYSVFDLIPRVVIQPSRFLLRGTDESFFPGVFFEDASGWALTNCTRFCIHTYIHIVTYMHTYIITYMHTPENRDTSYPKIYPSSRSRGSPSVVSTGFRLRSPCAKRITHAKKDTFWDSR